MQGAAEMHEMEHLLTVYASKAAKESVADFLGFCEVDEARGRLSRGLWLVWAYQGNKTLAYYLKRRDCIEALARDLGVPEDVVVPTVMRHIFQCLEVRRTCLLVQFRSSFMVRSSNPHIHAV